VRQIVFYLDFISPFSYLAFELLPRVTDTMHDLPPIEIHYRPLLLGAVLKHHGQKGPAELPSKRAWTYRHVSWLGHFYTIELEMPASHPYNPLPHLRLALSTSHNGDISREVAEMIFRDVWRGGQEAADPQRLADLQERLPQVREPNSDEVKTQLKSNTDAAIAAGVFGVPTFEIDNHQFWGLDSFPMLLSYIKGNDPWFDGPTWDSVPNRTYALRK
jgi:2-hydroxychromene-2-carboxylate isomerase